MINIDKVISLRTTRQVADSSIARILELVQHAAARKAKTEHSIRRFAKVYTPAVTFLAILLVFLPYFFLDTYVFEDWLYRGLIFLVISCPCALVISIPLGYFGGIGAASRNGILFKGSDFLDLITRVDTVVMDKTGTLTVGVFDVQDLVAAEGYDKTQILRLTAALETKSTHPVARAIVRYRDRLEEGVQQAGVEDVEEIAGQGLTGMVDGFRVLAGNFRLLKGLNISFDAGLDKVEDPVVAVAVYDGFGG